MITYVILQVLISLVGGLLSWLPTITVLPFGIDGYLSTGIGYFRGLFGVFPFLSTILTVALAYLSFRLVLQGAKVVLGHRAPHHN